jgi:hypothetical protein
VLLTHTAGYFVYDIFVVLTHWKDFKEDFCTLIHHGVGTIGRYTSTFGSLLLSALSLLTNRAFPVQLGGTLL